MVVDYLRILIVGNGIDIQFGGIEKRGNKAIIDRALANINSDKYNALGWDKKSVMDILETCVSTINLAINNRIRVPEEQDYLFLQMELERVRRTYKQDILLDEIGLEDIFLGAELLYVNSENETEKRLVELAIHDYLEPLLLDAIYDDSSVNEIYKNFPEAFIKYLKRYDAIYTLNYDTNLDSAIGNKVPVYHLHGSFDDLTERARNVPDGYKHMYCNGIMTWYWLEKYGEEEKDSRYGTDKFADVEGIVDIIGISPCNDEQLYIRMWQNTKLRSCNYFYYAREDAIEIRKHIKGTLERHITDRDVKRFWASFK